MSEPATAQIRVLITDDHEMVRRGLRTFLSLHEDIRVVGEAASAQECVELAQTSQPDVVLLDLKMPGEDGMSALRALKGTGARVLIVTSFTEVAQLLPAVREGAAGIVYKNIDPAALAAAIRSVHNGHILLPPEVARALMTSEPLGNLTPREREVLREIARGRSNREIARALNLAEKTVKTHVSNILMKLSVEDRTQAALYAVRHGLIT